MLQRIKVKETKEKNKTASLVVDDNLSENAELFLDKKMLSFQTHMKTNRSPKRGLVEPVEQCGNGFVLNIGRYNVECVEQKNSNKVRGHFTRSNSRKVSFFLGL